MFQATKCIIQKTTFLSSQNGLNLLLHVIGVISIISVLFLINYIKSSLWDISRICQIHFFGDQTVLVYFFLVLVYLLYVTHTLSPRMGFKNTEI